MHEKSIERERNPEREASMTHIAVQVVRGETQAGKKSIWRAEKRKREPIENSRQKIQNAVREVQTRVEFQRTQRPRQNEWCMQEAGPYAGR